MSYKITTREDVLSPWFDVEIDGEHCGSFKNPAEAIAYANDEPFGNDDEFALGPCGCHDYHYADCPTRG